MVVGGTAGATLPSSGSFSLRATLHRNQPNALSPCPIPQVVFLKPTLSTKNQCDATFTEKACFAHFLGRRHAFVGFGALVANLFLGTSDALAAKAPKGFQAVLDKFDGYQFLHPFGWQEVAVKGQDVVYKDIIEPLENVSVSIIETDKADVHELGSPKEVAEALVVKVLASPTQKTQLLDAKEKVAEGKTYYSFEFLAKASNFTRHALGTVAIANGKTFILTTGANERRWSKMEDKLRTVVDSFTLLN